MIFIDFHHHHNGCWGAGNSACQFPNMGLSWSRLPSIRKSGSLGLPRSKKLGVNWSTPITVQKKNFVASVRLCWRFRAGAKREDSLLLEVGGQSLSDRSGSWSWHSQPGRGANTVSSSSPKQRVTFLHLPGGMPLFCLFWSNPSFSGTPCPQKDLWKAYPAS